MLLVEGFMSVSDSSRFLPGAFSGELAEPLCRSFWILPALDLESLPSLFLGTVLPGYLDPVFGMAWQLPFVDSDLALGLCQMCAWGTFWNSW